MKPLCAASIAPDPIVDMIGQADLPAHHDKVSRPANCRKCRSAPAIRQWRPMLTLCAIWTRLSILVPSPMTVSRVEPRSIVVLAPISTSSWMMTRRDLRDLLMPARRRQIAEAVLADARAGMDDHAVADQRVNDRGAGADRAVAADARPRARSRRPARSAFRRRSRPRGPITASGSTVTPASSRAEG